MPFGAYVFDMDGVISDTQKIHAAHEYEFIQTLTRGQEVFYKGSVLTPDRITAEFAGIKATKWIGDILASSGIYKTPEELEAHLVRLHTHLAQEMQNTTILVEEIPGSRWFLGTLEKEKQRIAVVTASTKHLATTILRNLGVWDMVEVLRTAEDLLPYGGKWNPAVFHDLMKEMSLSSHDFIMFEDGKSGITGANAAGGKTMGVLGNRPESSLPDAHQYIRDFRGLTPIKLDKIMNSTYVRH